ncbi:RNA ligase RtcB family protein [Clostridium formicaceticum]|uniref:3'-phosphate/5'-hydroxy nucleic acid ligase n=1 Tax=Clostridium formicaceticum TaxID=1497 RepID=A0AAC9RLC5_9CLOT|nr:RNA ligase RtcB family protein [Clostridium formicaceticum]AOY76032.1 RNA ligase RtcB family protein [Clostridium formicaceticum]ARE86390.1 RNA-splicing ligase RtcB [Clostridium formicaceticum]
MSKTVLITNTKNWIEHIAITQLYALADLSGVIKAVGLPDLHAGKSPIGVAIITEGIIYPYIIGNDIGCGMGLFNTGIKKKKFRMERWVTKLNHISELADIEAINPYEEPSPIYDLGTIGSGNHFAEFQILEEVFEKSEFEKLNITKDDLLLLVHSGSRGYGQSILMDYSDPHGYSANSIEARNYITKHENALLWAERNRSIVANKLIDYLGYAPQAKAVIDCKHNFLEQKGILFIHRKGTVSAEVGAVVIPGSRGSLTYIVRPTNKIEESAYSLSHGAGRKWNRSMCKSRIREKYNKDTIRETKLKSRIVCHDTDLLFQEAPEAYKNIDTVIDSLLEFGLIKVIATLKPVLTYKG